MATDNELVLSGLSHWNLDLLNSAPNSQEILESLTRKVQELLDRDRALLFQAFYRLDIDEEKVNWVMRHEAKVTQAARLAELILNRELQKAKSRL